MSPQVQPKYLKKKCNCCFGAVKSQQQSAVVSPQCPNFLKGNLRQEMLEENQE
jgi:hypothetical protein